jgi:hypothetical protein
LKTFLMSTRSSSARQQLWLNWVTESRSYCPLYSFSLRDFWKCLDGYQTHDWADLKLALEKIYDGTLASSRCL